MDFEPGLGGGATTSAPTVDASDRKFYVQASDKTGDKSIIETFDDALATQQAERRQADLAAGDEAAKTDEGRPLTAGEERLARSVFGDSINYEDVRIRHRSFLPLGLQPNDVAMAPDGNIYFDPSGDLYRSDFSDATLNKQALFIHEMTHIWQHQQGTNVIARGIFEREYDYQIDESTDRFEDYNIEQQGDIARDYFYLKNGVARDGRPSIDVYQDILPFVDDPTDAPGLNGLPTNSPPTGTTTTTTPPSGPTTTTPGTPQPADSGGPTTTVPESTPPAATDR